MTRKISKIALALGVALFAAPLHAQSNCAPRDTIIERLEGQFGEALAGGGLRSEMQVIEIWAARETGTWTVLMSRADGLACVMASGTNWHQQDPELALMDVPS